ncbi:MAG: hypothetical protein ACOX7N_07140 [Lawsonibacter sp.]|jgi:hypothetical protein
MVCKDYEWDEILRRRAKEEDCPISQEFDVFLARQLENLPAWRAERRRLRKMVLLVAAVVLLTACVGATVVTLKQNRTFYFDTLKEAGQAANEGAAAAGASTAAVGVQDGLPEYPGAQEVDLEIGMSFYQGEGEEILEHAFGGAEDGWTERFTAQNDYLVIQQYKADRLSGLLEMWPMEKVPDLVALEKIYPPVPGCQSSYTQTSRETGKLRYLGFYGDFQSSGEGQFSLDWTFHPVGKAGDQYVVATGLDKVEEYQTADGAIADIQWDTAPSGKSVFRVEVSYGYVDFTMNGTQLEEETIHTILDSLNLSELGEYQSKH